MTRKLYSIRDKKAEAFNLPFGANTHGEAERNFARLAKDPQSMVASFPNDYALYFLGEFNDFDGKMSLLDSPQHIVDAVLLNKED